MSIRCFKIYRIFLIILLIFILKHQIPFNYNFQNGISLEINSTTEFHSIFKSRFNQRLIRLGQRYSHINIDLLLSIQKTSTKIITYYCQTHCGGWGDRLRGITSTYILSLLLQRRFVIDMKYPCQLSNFLLPNLINWIPKNNNSTKNLNYLQLNSISSKYQNELYLNISTINLTKFWLSYDNIFLTTNNDYITPALKNPFFKSIISQIHIRLNESTQQELFPLIFELLFKPNSFITEQLDFLLQKTSKQSIICMHIRLGQNPTIPKDVKLSYRQSLVQHMTEFIDRNLSHLHSSIFVTSDSIESVKYLQKHYGTKRILNIDGPIIHIDRYDSKTLSSQLIYQGFRKLITDFYFLGECDFVLMPKSGFSYWANRRRTNQYSNLYIYCRELYRVTSEKWQRPYTIC